MAIVPFPAARRVGQIRKTALYMVSASDAQAEAHLAHQLHRLAQSLGRRGVSPDVIGSQCAAYESAIRATIWQLARLPDDAA